MLWFHCDKLDSAVEAEVERAAMDMWSGDGVSAPHLYLPLIVEADNLVFIEAMTGCM